jgi:hypothetical protein
MIHTINLGPLSVYKIVLTASDLFQKSARSIFHFVIFFESVPSLNVILVPNDKIERRDGR